RIRVVFSADAGCVPSCNPSQTQRWAFIPPQLKVIGDLAHHLARQIQQPQSKKARRSSSLVLTLDGFVLPPTESLDILRETDVV
ncbi:unnamed protein product, partial [Hapterophycus canaliculatus]